MIRSINGKVLAASAVLALSAACLAFAACSAGAASYNDGTYTGQSAVYEGSDYANGYGVATITIKGNQIVDAEFLTYEPDGTLKDEGYGRTANNNQDFYNKAQKAVEACKKYAAQLVEVGNVDGVDTVSGATISHDEFVEAVNDALGQAAV